MDKMKTRENRIQNEKKSLEHKRVMMPKIVSESYGPHVL